MGNERESQGFRVASLVCVVVVVVVVIIVCLTLFFWGGAIQLPNEDLFILMNAQP